MLRADERIVRFGGWSVGPAVDALPSILFIVNAVKHSQRRMLQARLGAVHLDDWESRRSVRRAPTPAQLLCIGVAEIAAAELIRNRTSMRRSQSNLESCEPDRSVTRLEATRPQGEASHSSRQTNYERGPTHLE